MLKALELVGFKSFADRTRFDFPDGITVVVGPNGSGKSNVVDAVKWVLGSQSAKSLRGADMGDVIFKGSAAGGRRPSNSAEVTLILDNSNRTFRNDSDEVHVCRRTFRSGDTEYSINGEPCRLKDIKELFRGTGVGVDDYSLIEQGKVDRLLQASAKDRRSIFEEAAGISRFKAKKVEAERRLQRVEQNLLRLSDIVDEVGRRLNTLKSQASKAQRYREITQQLAIKRSQLGWVEYQLLMRQRRVIESQWNEAEENKVLLAAKLKELEQAAERERALLAELQQLQSQLQHRYLAAQREAIEAETGFQAASQRSEDLHAECSIVQERLQALQERASLGAEETIARQLELEQLELERSQAAEKLAIQESNLASAQKGLQDLEGYLTSQQQTLQELSIRSNDLRSRIVAYQLHIGELQRSIEELKVGEQAVKAELENFDSESLELRNNLAQAAQIAEDIRNRRREAEAALQSRRESVFKKQEAVASLQGRLHGVRERLQVLEQLEDQFTAAGRGGQQLLRLARANQTNHDASALTGRGTVDNAWNTVQGLVADLLSSEMHIAPLIDVALGPLADAIVLTNGQIVEWINEGGLSVEGRVTLLRLDRLPNRRSGEKIQLDGLRGVIGRADRMSHYSPEYEPLMRALLGTTWIVDTLATALELSHFRGAGLRFVTAECQLVDSDGSITIGALQAGLGLISRRTEMQNAREERTNLQAAVENAVSGLQDQQSQLQADEAHLREIEKAERKSSQQLSRYEAQMEASDARRSQIVDKHEKILQQIAAAEARAVDLENQCVISEGEIESIEKLKVQAEEAMAAIKLRWNEQQVQLQAHLSATADQRVQLARLEQRLDGLRLTLEQLQLDASERSKNVEMATQTIEVIVSKIESSKAVAADCQQRIESSRLLVAQLEASQKEQSQKIEVQNASTNSAIRQSDSGRRQLEKNDDRIQTLQSSLDLIETQSKQLIEHYRVEYEVLLPVESHATDIANPIEGWDRFVKSIDSLESAAEVERVKHEIESEIVHLRNEVAQTGSVNMEALAELDELQSRFDRLSTHQNDLFRAKQELQSTMTKIDEDSRHLFVETLQSIRKNFQDLYRRSFGGGFADIILENESDPESGIEIVATPPGKTTLSNSLLSGGEKALTAVALIMAFFQYRPSPFCILDEVDAPFDEANIGRFVSVLREFLDSTKFIVVTHSKKTMTAANMIYGVTMQESGVSRQVSVRFEEVNDKGEIIAPRKRVA